MVSIKDLQNKDTWTICCPSYKEVCNPSGVHNREITLVVSCTNYIIASYRILVIWGGGGGLRMKPNISGSSDNININM